jgi:hypothetical protein
MYDLHQRAVKWSQGLPVLMFDEDVGHEVEVRQEGWYAEIMPASQTGLIPEAELRAIKADVGRSKYAQEMECDFDAEIEGAIYGKEMAWLRRKGRFGHYPVMPGIPVHTAWDLGWDDATAIIFFQALSPEDIRVVDYYEDSFASLPDYVDMLVKRDYMYGYHLLPGDVEVTELGSGKSRREILQSLGVRATPVVVKSKPDGIASAQALLPYMRFDQTKAARLIDCLSLYQRKFNESLQTYGKEPLHNWCSHGADALMHLALGLRASAYNKSDRPEHSTASRQNMGN